MRAPFTLLLHALVALWWLALGPAWAQPPGHGPHPAVAAARLAAPAATGHVHTACDSHRLPGAPMASHGSTLRCQQACLALSAGFAAVLPMQVPALRLADAASPHPDARHALPTGRVVMPERRPPKAT